MSQRYVCSSEKKLEGRRRVDLRWVNSTTKAHVMAVQNANPSFDQRHRRHNQLSVWLHLPRHPSTLCNHCAISLVRVSNILPGAHRCSSNLGIRPKTQSHLRRPLATVATPAISHGSSPSCHLSYISIVLTSTQGANQSGLGGGPPGQGGDNKDKKDPKVPLPPPI